MRGEHQADREKKRDEKRWHATSCTQESIRQVRTRIDRRSGYRPTIENTPPSNRTFLWGLLTTAFVLRLLPMLIWPNEACVRDECMYVFTAERMLEGQGMTATNGWMWAPGYISVIAAHLGISEWVTGVDNGLAGSIWGLQLLCALGATWLLLDLGRRTFDERTARIAAGLYAVSPTYVFFTKQLWSEALYGPLILLLIWALVRLRQSGWAWACFCGALAGLCVLFKGVAVYMTPLLLFVVIWKRTRQRSAWLHGLLLLAVAAAVVTPYSLYASNKFGTTIISDRSLGQMMWLGNNVFEPVTFDWGNGQIPAKKLARHTKIGRERCAPKSQPMKRDTCETAAGVAWIEANPTEFFRRIPMRVAQTMNPHSFLTRHLRWNRWKGLPQWVDEVLIGLVVLFSLLASWGAAIGAWGRGGGPVLIGAAVVTAYHLAACAALAGLTRYRLPIEALWYLFAAAALADPKRCLSTLRQHRWRACGALCTLGLVAWTTLWYLPVGFKWWGAW